MNTNVTIIKYTCTAIAGISFICGLAILSGDKVL